MKWLWRITVVLLALLLGGCGRLGTPEKEGVLVLGMVSEPVIEFYDGVPTEGFTRDFATLFGQHIGLPVRVQVAINYEELTAWTLAGQVHVAAYVNASPENKGLSFSAPIGTRALWVVKRVDARGPKTLEELRGEEIHTPVKSAAAVSLKSLPRDMAPTILERSDRDEMDLFEDIAQGRIQFAAVDDLYMQYAVNTYPEVQPTVLLPGNRVFAWALPPGTKQEFRSTLDAFIVTSQQNGTLARLRDKYFSYLQRLDALGAQRFISDIETKLPVYKAHFHKAQETTGIDWRQLAALAYQESKWDSQAVSYTGVRGMMMLTKPTARATGILDRDDPEQSIRGGSQYLVDLMEQIPSNVAQPDRLWLALAAYNLGMGHVRSARSLAERLQKNPDSWLDMKSVLPLLARPKFFGSLKTGRARGGEAVILVENVRSYYGILANLEPAYVKAKALEKSKALPKKKLRKKRPLKRLRR